MRPLRLLLALFALLCLPPAQANGPVVLVLGDGGNAAQEFAEAFRAEWKRLGMGAPVQVQSGKSSELTGASVVVAVGTNAANEVISSGNRLPLLIALQPRMACDRTVDSRAELRAACLYIDQPPARQIELIRQALPEQMRIGLLAGGEGGEIAERIAAAARHRGLQATVANTRSSGDIYPALIKLFAEPGVLVATPEASLFNAQTLPNILLTAYRLRAPVVGFSPAYLKAGALLALYTSPAQSGQQAAEMARTAVNTGSLPTSQYPRQFAVGINPHVARSLGINLPTQDELRERLERVERNP